MNWTKSELFQFDRSRRSIRRFGLLLAALILVYFTLRWVWRGELIWPGFAVGLLIGLLALVYWRGVRVIYIPWMVIVRIIGFIVTHILLAIVFYLIFTPVGLIRRLLGWDPLQRRRTADSYWIQRDPDQQGDLERMF
jgi:hypothetical protein